MHTDALGMQAKNNSDGRFKKIAAMSPGVLGALKTEARLKTAFSEMES